ncbi:MAG: nucleotidyl transferase AbiEii/AbiGii toxin family protein [Clostridia bacterium]|nr:nucleotidyl transferase AbiEii/AbiGii toxin family protein [Clostridia bacterium]
MLSKENFADAHIRELQARSHRDPVLLERAVYAFGLLEALSTVGLPFIFKGGTCLMLLMEHPRRLSTDIDIIVEPGTDVDAYISKAAEIFPFVRMDEQIRKGRNNIEKRHFKFIYDSPVNGREFYILLDILFEQNHYVQIDLHPICNELLITEGKPSSVWIPNADCILADKLTAYAPHTTGIPLNVGKDMEVMKQLYDVSNLIDLLTDQSRIQQTYQKISAAEIAYRGTDITPEDCLWDTFMASACIASRGKILPGEYPAYVKGIRDVRAHIYYENYSPEVAAVRCPRIMYLALCLLTGELFSPVSDASEYIMDDLQHAELKPLKYLRKANAEAYSYAIKADQLLNLLPGYEQHFADK